MIARLVLALALSIQCTGAVLAQSDEPLEIFGYFQPSYTHNFPLGDSTSASGTFVVQQLNLFMQRDLAPKWLGLVNVEFINSYSSSRRWGSLSLEEAWVRYRKSPKFNLKIGLHIPTFNHLNEIKNKTPLLPFITRPLAYETSLGEVLPLEDLAPSQAFISAYGAKPAGKFRLDYALYLGNSPNVVTPDEVGAGAISGEDGSDTFMTGSRLGFRWKTLKVGFSGTLDFVNSRRPLAHQLGVAPVDLPNFLEISPDDLVENPRTRLGSDVTWDWKGFYSESETTNVAYHNLPAGIEQEFDFQYSLLGYDISDQWSIYTMTSLIGIETTVRGMELKNEIWAWSPGFVYQAFDRVSVKGQYHWVRIKDRITEINSDQFHRFSGAISVIF